MQNNEDTILQFAKMKLLDNKSSLMDASVPSSLACLSVWFALKLTTDGHSQAVAHRQVEHYMWLCLAATTGFEHLVTLAGSELLLAKASVHCG